MDVNNKNKEYYTVDLAHIAKTLWKRIWIIILSAIVCAALGFAFASYAIAPKYSSSIMLYVNNSSFSLGNTSFSISSSEITASQSLVKTYGEILNNRTTLQKVIDQTGLTMYSYRDLSEMIYAEPSNGTEIMKITVTTEDPYEAAEIANCIAEILPKRISEIIDGASMEVVDSAIPIHEKVSPSITRYTAVGLVLGAIISIIILIIVAVSDDTVHDEEYILQTYDYPILAKLPDLLHTGSKKKYSYYYTSSHKNR